MSIDDYFRILQPIAIKFGKAWPKQRDATLAVHEAYMCEIGAPFGLRTTEEITSFVEENGGESISRLCKRLKHKQLTQPIEKQKLAETAHYLQSFVAGKKLGQDIWSSVLSHGTLSILTPREVYAMRNATVEEMKSIFPVYMNIRKINDEYLYFVLVAGDANEYTNEDITSTLARDKLTILINLFERDDIRHAPPSIGLEGDEMRSAYRNFARVFWDWYEKKAKRPEDNPEYRHPSLYLSEIAQQTWPEVKTLKRSLALAKSEQFGKYWTMLEHELQMRFSEDRMYEVQIEVNLLPDWLNGPKDIQSLREEVCSLRSPVKTINLAIARLVTSKEAFLDIDLDDFMDDIGIKPRSTEERLSARMDIFRALMIIGATRVIGSRSKIFDRATKTWVNISCGDPLINVTPWHETGKQFSFEPGVAPLRVRLYAMPFLLRYRGNDQALQYFGNLLEVSKLPTGKPSNAVAVSIADALNQIWREQATSAKYEWVTRTNKEGIKEKLHRTAIFKPFTRRQLLELFPPETSIMELINGEQPDRAVEYIESAFRTLMESPTRTIEYFSGYEGAPLIDWSKKARKARGFTRERWKPNYLEEKLDVRPPPERVEELWKIKQGQPKRRGGGPKKRKE